MNDKFEKYVSEELAVIDRSLIVQIEWEKSVNKLVNSFEETYAQLFDFLNNIRRL